MTSSTVPQDTSTSPSLQTSPPSSSGDSKAQPISSSPPVLAVDPSSHQQPSSMSSPVLPTPSPSTVPMTPTSPPEAVSTSINPTSLLEVDLEGQENSRNWPQYKKVYTAAILSLMGFIGPMGASVIIAGAPDIKREFELSHTLSILPISLFVLGLGAGPFCLAPASELNGRQPIYVISATIFTLFNIGSAVAPNFPALCILRFFAGVFGSSGPSLGAGTIGDMFVPNERGTAQAIYGLGPLLGLVMGNIIGGWVDQKHDDIWRLLMWILTAMSGSFAVILILFLKETYQPVQLRRKKARVAAEALKKATASNLDSPDDDVLKQLAAVAKKPTLRGRALALIPGQAAKDKLKIAFSRPFRLLFTNPICAAFSVYMGFCYGIIFLFLVEQTLLFQKRSPEDEKDTDHLLPNYGFSPGANALTYLGLGLGFLFSAIANAMLQDRIYKRLVASRGKLGKFLFKTPDEIDAIMDARDAAMEEEKDVEQANGTKDGGPATPRSNVSTPDAKSGQGDPMLALPPLPYSPDNAVARKGEPEYRLPLCLLGMVLMPFGLLLFGWTGQEHVHWFLPLIGSVLVGFATFLPFQSILVYLVDAFIPYSASATACAVLVRSILAAAFPLFSQELYKVLGFGWGSSLLALVSLFGIPAPIILFKYGGYLRNKYRFIE